ncbi:MAG TPA: TIGR03435 family protein [Candidatus Acidoferrales bacterium]|nr:TIGR03435 family protein [Candidatus Acidoferrales bacterium]
MSRTLFAASALFAAAAMGQTPAFDVASVRASQGGGGGRGMNPFGNRVVVSPDSVIMRNISFRSCVGWAYHVMDYQVSGPDWIGSERYTITAKAAGEVPEDELRLMMQNLLAERFKMAVHRQTKEMQAYLLQVAKGGVKLKESTSEGEADIKPDQQRMTVSVQRTPVSQLIDVLSNIFRAPVIDETGLKGKYDITVNVAKYIADFGPAGAGRTSEVPPDPLNIVTRALQEELGLKLEPKKTAVDLVIVDHAEKVPVEN